MGIRFLNSPKKEGGGGGHIFFSHEKGRVGKKEGGGRCSEKKGGLILSFFHPYLHPPFLLLSFCVYVLLSYTISTSLLGVTQDGSADV